MDDFLIAGSDSNPIWQDAKKNDQPVSMGLKWERTTFHLCGVRYKQHNDYSISLDQEDYTKSLVEADFNPPPDYKKQ